MDKFTAMQVFVAVVDGGSFTKAAARLDLSRAAVSKYVARLEDALGARLLNRTTRRVGLTEAGSDYYERCRRILSDLEEADESVGRLQSKPRGTLRVIAPINFGALHLGDAIAAFLERYPHLRLEMELTDRYIDPIEGGYDIAIRVGAPPDSSLIARKLNESRRLLCASPDYLDKNGYPERPIDLKNHRCLSYSYSSAPEQWELTGKDGNHVIKVSGPLVTSHGAILRQCMLENLGIAMGPQYFFYDDIKAGRAVHVLPDYKLPEASIYGVYASHRLRSAKVKAFVDFIIEFYRAHPPMHGELPREPVRAAS